MLLPRVLSRAFAASGRVRRRWTLAPLAPFLAVLCVLCTSLGPARGGGEGENTPPRATGNEDREYRIKAAFLLHFVRYATWPKSSFRDEASPIQVTVIGPNPFGGVLEETFRNEVIQGRRIEVAYAREVPRVPEGHLVFCSGLSRAAREELLSKCRKRPILLVGESPAFAEEGACVNFYIHEQKTRFEINTDALGEASLEISPAVLKLARLVRTRGGNS